MRSKIKNGDDCTRGELDWENRTLCSDESCIGVIGPDGRCKECEKPFDEAEAEKEGHKRYQADAAAEPDDPDSDETDEDDDIDEEEYPDDPDWESRTLCSDESCIGLIGPDGRCKECGKSYA
jgi:hypothetical protein